MEIVKKMTLKMKALVGIVLAGLVIAVVAFRKYVTDNLSDGGLERQEEALAKESETKLAEEKAKLEAQKTEELAAVEEKKAADKKALDEAAVAEKETLKTLARKDKKAFKGEVEKRLGVREKKTPGRKPKGK